MKLGGCPQAGSLLSADIPELYRLMFRHVLNAIIL